MINLLLPFAFMIQCFSVRSIILNPLPQAPIDERVVKPIIKYGIASYYANKFHGRRTANGNIYDAKKFTAACNRLPLNVWIKVTNLSNDLSVIVKVNDRLHPKNKRLVDLSYAAAKKLKIIGRGIAKVKVEVIRNFNPSAFVETD